MAEYEITSSTTSSNFTSNNPAYDGTTDCISIHNSATFTINANFSAQYIWLGENGSGTAGTKAGTLTNSGSHTLTITAGGGNNGIRFGGSSGSNAVLDIDGLDIDDNANSYGVNLYSSSNNGGSVSVKNCTIDGSKYACIHDFANINVDTEFDNVTMNNISNSALAFDDDANLTGTVNISNCTLNSDVRILNGFTNHDTLIVVGNTITQNGTWLEYRSVNDLTWYNNKRTNDSDNSFAILPYNQYDKIDYSDTQFAPASWSGMGDDFSVSDNGDGTFGIVANEIDGTPAPYYKIFVRQGASPGYSANYLWGLVPYNSGSSVSVDIGAWNNNGTYEKVTANQTYYVQVQAYNDLGTVNGNTTGTVTPTGGGAGTSPGRPTITAEYSGSSGEADITITDGSPAGDSYNIYYRTPGGNWIANTGNSAGVTTITNLTDNVTYEFVAVGLNPEGALGVPSSCVYVYIGSEILYALLSELRARLQAQITSVNDNFIKITTQPSDETSAYPAITIEPTTVSVKQKGAKQECVCNIQIYCYTYTLTANDGTDSTEELVKMLENVSSSLNLWTPSVAASVTPLVRSSGTIQEPLDNGWLLYQSLSFDVQYYLGG